MSDADIRIIRPVEPDTITVTADDFPDDPSLNVCISCE